MSQREPPLGDRYAGGPQSRQGQLLASSHQHRGYRSSSHHDDPLQYQTTSSYQSLMPPPHHHPPSAIYTPHYNHHHQQPQPLSIVNIHPSQRWVAQPPPPSNRPSSRQSYPPSSTQRQMPDSGPLPTQQPQQQQTSSNVMRSGLAVPSRARDVAAHSPSGGGAAKKSSPTVIKPVTSPRASKVVTDPNAPAMPAAPVPPIDHDHDAMTTGLRLQQQEWNEKGELKKVITDVSLLVNCLQSTTTPKNSNSSNSTVPLNEIKSLIDGTVKEHIELLKSRVLSKMHSIKTKSKDIEGLAQELTNRDKELMELREGQLANVTSELHRAKRKRRFHSEFERLAGECLAKKPRLAYAEEQAKEQEKLTKVQKATKVWKEVGEYRSRQVDITLCHLKELLDNLKNPEAIIEQLQQSKERETANLVPDSTAPTD